MSWNFTVNGSDRDEVLLHLDKELATGMGGIHAKLFSAQIKGAALALTEVLSHARVVSLRTYGHVNPDGSGNIHISVNC